MFPAGNRLVADTGWGDPISIDVEGPAGTELAVFMRSVPTPLTVATIPADGLVTIEFAIDSPAHPGIHQIVIADANTGEELFVGETNVVVPVECDTATTPGPDVDGDELLDACDTNPLDGPLGDADFDLVLNSDDNCVLVPNPDQLAATDRSSGNACDPRQGFNQVPTIVPAADYQLPPATDDDQTTVVTGGTVAIDVLTNDTATDAAIDPSSLTVLSAPDLGAATISGDAVEFTASDQAGTTTLTYAVCDVTQRCSVAEVTITITDDGPPPVPCGVMVIDSFQAAPWTFTFQIRNSSNQPVDFEFVIPNANYELTNLQFNGSGQNLVLTQASNGDGTFDITVSGSVPAYQSVGGQQPNGFNGQLTPAQEAPIVTCQ